MNTPTQKFSTYPDQTNHTQLVVKALLIGGLVGAGTMLFLAPQSGRKLRANLQKKTHELREHTAETVKDAVSQVKSRGHQIKAQIKDDVRGKADDIQHQGIDVLVEQLERISSAVEAGMKALKSSR